MWCGASGDGNGGSLAQVRRHRLRQHAQSLGHALIQEGASVRQKVHLQEEGDQWDDEL